MESMETMELVELMEWTTSLQNKTAIRYGKMLSFCDECILKYDRWIDYRMRQNHTVTISSRLMVLQGSP